MKKNHSLNKVLQSDGFRVRTNSTHLKAKYGSGITALCALIILVGLSSCSRNERKTEEKSAIKTSEIRMSTLRDATVNMTANPPNLSTVATNVMKPQGISAKFTPVDSSAPESQEAVQERQRAMRERQQVFAAAAVKNELPRVRLTYDRELQDLTNKELEARENDPRVKDAYANLLAVRNEYEAMCVKAIPGYEDLAKSSGILRARMEELNSLQRKGQVVDSKEILENRRNLNQVLLKISQMRTVENSSDSAIGESFLKVMADQSAYEQSLLKNNGYLNAKEKSDQTLALVAKLSLMEDPASRR